MSDHYETRCPSCGGSDEQGCYADCPTTTITALRAENERLRAALWDIHAVCNNGPFVWARRIRAIARAALEEKQ